jgi:hypothetical protein
MQALVSEPLDLAGEWRVTHRVDASRRPDLVGLNIEFRMAFTQDGSQLSGYGEKILVDRQQASPDEISHLEVTGWASQTSVQVALIEVGRARTIVGDIAWSTIHPHRMAGSFRVDFAQTSGRSEAVRRAL